MAQIDGVIPSREKYKLVRKKTTVFFALVLRSGMTFGSAYVTDKAPPSSVASVRSDPEPRYGRLTIEKNVSKEHPRLKIFV